MKPIQFITFRDLTSSYNINQLKKENPSSINFLEYRMFNITIELIEEPKDILIERLENMLKESKHLNERYRIIAEINKLKL